VQSWVDLSSLFLIGQHLAFVPNHAAPVALIAGFVRNFYKVDLSPISTHECVGRFYALKQIPPKSHRRITPILQMGS
jgi:hypothetical protein